MLAKTLKRKRDEEDRLRQNAAQVVYTENVAGEQVLVDPSATEADLTSHIANATNPHSVTKTQVGLGNVTDDAQLKRASGDINTFSEKESPVDVDIVLIEDSAAGYAKKKVKLSNLPYAGEAYHEEFENETTVIITHNIGARPLVQVVGATPSLYGAGLYGAGVYGGDQDDLLVTPSQVKHNSVNQVTVTLSTAKTGEVICIG